MKQSGGNDLIILKLSLNNYWTKKTCKLIGLLRKCSQITKLYLNKMSSVRHFVAYTEANSQPRSFHFLKKMNDNFNLIFNIRNTVLESYQNDSETFYLQKARKASLQTI